MNLFVIIDRRGGGKNRIAYLDALKCLGILMVIKGHVKFMGMGINDTYENPSSLMMYSFNMPIFFFVSGLLAFNGNDLGKLGTICKLKDKFLFLVLPALCFAAYFKLYDQERVLDLFTKGFGMYWFTFTLFEIFVLYCIAVAFSRSKLMLLTILSILSIVGVGYLSFFSKYEIAFLDFNHLAKYFQYFSLGVAARMYATIYDRIMRSEALRLISIGAFFVILTLLFYDFLPSIAYRFLRDIVLRWLGTFVVVAWFYSNKERFDLDTRLNKWISKIGKNSLAIYMLQYFFLPNLQTSNELISNMDVFSIHIFSLVYSIIITLVCLLFIDVLSTSKYIKRFALGKK